MESDIKNILGKINEPYLKKDFVTLDFVKGISQNGDIVPVEYALSQNYPNPFNPTTKVNYALPKNGFVTLKVYNILGVEVANLVNENKPAGNYSVDFNASELSSGIYFYSINVNGFTDTKRMMLIK